MWSKSKLTREIAGIVLISAAIAFFLFEFLYITGGSLVIKYQDAKGIVPTETMLYMTDTWLFGLSLAASAIIFTVLFLVLMGQKLSYLRKIIEGIEALQTHRMNHTIPLEGNNEFTELADSINFLAETERHLAEQERQLQQERESFIRAMSHDIRTPLTSILSYSQYAKDANSLSKADMDAYIDLVQRKATQIKELTDRLLENSNRKPKEISNGKLLLTQLAEEWASELEEGFDIVLDYENCPDFTGLFDIGELQRTFDNLASNVVKYADPDRPVALKLYRAEDTRRGAQDPEAREETKPNTFLAIQQSNFIKSTTEDIESNGIGLESIRRIAKGYGGRVEVIVDTPTTALPSTVPAFCIKIYLKINL